MRKKKDSDITLTYDPASKKFYLRLPYEKRHLAKQAGFLWDTTDRTWYTYNKEIAVQFREYADKDTKNVIGFVTFTPEMRDKILLALREVAFKCDWATTKDGHGFNKADVKTGKALAFQPVLNDQQAYIAKKILRKYKRQINGQLYREIYKK